MISSPVLFTLLSEEIILRFHLTEIGRVDLLDEIHDMNIWLEFGVSQETQIALMSLGQLQ